MGVSVGVRVSVRMHVPMFMHPCAHMRRTAVGCISCAYVELGVQISDDHIYFFGRSSACTIAWWILHGTKPCRFMRSLILSTCSCSSRIIEYPQTCVLGQLMWIHMYVTLFNHPTVLFETHTKGQATTSRLRIQSDDVNGVETFVQHRISGTVSTYLHREGCPCSYSPCLPKTHS